MELAKRMGSKLVLFRAVTIPNEPAPPEFLTSPEPYGVLLERRAREQLESASREVDPARLAGIHVEIGVPWEAICQAAKTDDVDCIIIGAHNYHGLDRVLGTTASKVVNHADRTVLVVRAADRLKA